MRALPFIALILITFVLTGCIHSHWTYKHSIPIKLSENPEINYNIAQKVYNELFTSHLLYKEVVSQFPSSDKKLLSGVFMQYQKTTSMTGKKDTFVFVVIGIQYRQDKENSKEAEEIVTFAENYIKEYINQNSNRLLSETQINNN